MSDCIHCDIHDLLDAELGRDGADLAQIAAKVTEVLADLVRAQKALAARRWPRRSISISEQASSSVIARLTVEVCVPMCSARRSWPGKQRSLCQA